MNKITKIFAQLKPKAKYILGILGIAAIVSQGAFAFTKLSATEPRFNFLSGDKELFRGANITEGNSVWRDPVEGSIGDEFQGIIYYHNGMVDTVAQNTKIKVTIPAQTANKTAKLAATISADNAGTVSDTVVDGQIVGLSGLTVNLDQNANLEFVPGSVRWYPEQLENPNVPVSLPGGQTGDTLITSGVNIGDINGCWNYAGYLVFNFRTKTIEQPNLGIEKQVRNVTAGQTTFAEQVDAGANEVVEFNIGVTNTGNANLADVIAKDALPADLTYVDGSLKLDGVALSSAQAAAYFANGTSIGSFAVGANKVITFQATAPSEISVAKLVTNTAFAVSGALSVSDIAKVNLTPCEVPHIVPHKTAKNLTTGQVAATRVVAGREMLTLDALAGNEIKYTLNTKNTGNATAQNYVIEDGIADILEYANVIGISDGGSVVNGTTGNDAKLVIWPAVNIAPGETVTRTFTVRVLDPIPNTPANGFHFDMQMYNKYGDEVIVYLSVPTPPPTAPLLHIGKTVRNVTSNELNFVESDTATPGDILEYMITFSNTGNGPADLIRFSDVLPDGTNYIVGTTVLSLNGSDEHTMADGIVGEGVMLDTLAAGDSGYIKFRVATNASLGNGATLVNTANLTDNGVTISDTAQTVIQAIVKASTPLPRTGANLLFISAIISAVFAAAGMAVISKLR